MTRNEWNRRIRDRLASAGVEAAAFESAELLCAVLGIPKIALISEGDAPVPASDAERLDALCERRAGGYPLQYLIGEWDFYGYPISVGEGVLIPRADTEILCEQVIRQVGDRPLTVLDLCSGSGCLAIAIAKQCPNASVYAVERSETAFGYLTRNREKNGAGVRAYCMDALSEEALSAIPDCDVILSNPPYLTEADMRELQTEVRFEPPEALYGDRDGLRFYRELTARWKSKLKPGGMLIYEVGRGQSEAVEEILSSHGFISICETPDVCGIIRVVGGFYRA